MSSEDKEPGADAPGQGKICVRHLVEGKAAQAASIRSETNARRLASPWRRRAEAVVDPISTIDEPGTEASALTTHLPPEALVRLVLFAGRMAKKQGRHLPRNIDDRLGEALARGDATAPALRDWAVRIGVLADEPGRSSDGTHNREPELFGVGGAAEHDLAMLRAVALARLLRQRLGMNRRGRRS